MFPEIRPGAVFIADAHYTDERTGLVGLLASFQASPPPQVFLMGDIFDLHIGPFPYLHRRNQPLIEQIEALAATCEVWYFEGNHDFLLEGCLSGVHYVPLGGQPMIFRFGDEQIALAHGDYDEGLLHGLFTRLIRSAVGIRLIHLMTFNFLGN